ncbi:MAG: septal ring lytic transglycosylase RlpA family protein [Alphaproteobacteria bacterium]|nr:septal ring lytic transglycosylase RlpA family protein [Alphaproteobacteria bacterium]
MLIRTGIAALLCGLLVLPGLEGGRKAFDIGNTADAATVARTNHDRMYRQIGTASWYGPGFNGRRTASGTRFDRHRLTAAHRSLPLGTKARITNLENGRSVEVTVTDRGPYVDGRVIDLSEKAATLLGMKDTGLATVAIEVPRDDLS